MAVAYTIAWIIYRYGGLLPTTTNHCLLSYGDDIRAIASLWTAMCVASARRLGIVSFQNVLWQRADTRVQRLASVPETERLNLAPEPGDIKFYL